MVCFAIAASPAIRALEVTTTLDNGSAGTLRSRVVNAAPGETITFNASLNGQTIALTLGQLAPTQNLTIDASALPSGITLNGLGTTRHLSVAAGRTIVVNAVTFVVGNAPDGGPGQSGGDGGAILNLGTLTLNDCSIIACSAGSGGTGAFTSGGGGGAIANGTLVGSVYQSGTLTLNRCTLLGNRSGNANGAQFSYAGGGGAIVNPGGTLTLDQCTLTGNFTGSGYHGFGVGGAIDHSGTLVLNQCTIVDNRTGAHGDGGGVLVTNSSTLTMTNTVIARNPTDASTPTAYADLSDVTSGNITWLGKNFIGNPAGLNSVPAGTLTGDPQISASSNYGGRLATFLPLNGSPLINPAGGPVSSPFATDQRGYPRVFGATVDIGATEWQPFQAVSLLMREDFQSSGSQSFRSTWWPTQTSFPPAPAVVSNELRLTANAGGLNNSVAWNAVPMPNPEVTLSVDFRMSADPSGSYAADGWGIGLFNTNFYGATDANNPADNDVNQRNWEDMSTLPCFPNAIAIGFDIFNWGAPDRITVCSPAPDGTGVLRFSSDLGFNLNDGFQYRMRLTLRESGTDTLATLAILPNPGGSLEEFTIFTDLVLPGVKITQFPARLIAGGRTGGFAVATDLDNVILSSAPTVTTLADENNATGTLGAFSLREALRDANPDWDPVIRFAPALSGGTLTLTNGQLLASKRLCVDASGLPAGITLNGGLVSRILEVAAGTVCEFRACTFTGGQPPRFGNTGQPGGAILNAGTLTLTRSTLRGNRTAGGTGTGAGGDGGAIHNSWVLITDRCTIADNQAGNGGAAGGRGGFGGGIYNTGLAELISTTVANNSAGSFNGRGGGVLNAPSSIFHLRNSIVALNTDFGGTPDVFAENPDAITSAAYDANFVGNLTGSDLIGFGIISGNPRLAPLASYGGPTWTRPPLPGSIVIDNGIGVLATVDQRGAPRSNGPAMDIGATESFAFLLLPLVDTDGDGIDDRLEPAYPGLTVGINDSTRDTDGDGQTDAVELKAMMDPQDRFSSLRIVAFQTWSPGQYFIAWTSFPGLMYQVDRDLDLNFTGADFSTVSTMYAESAGQTTSTIVDGVGTKSFFRVRIAP